jgi:hypothetical protein
MLLQRLAPVPAVVLLSRGRVAVPSGSAIVLLPMAVIVLSHRQKLDPDGDKIACSG